MTLIDKSCAGSRNHDFDFRLYYYIYRFFYLNYNLTYTIYKNANSFENVLMSCHIYNYINKSKEHF